MSTLTSTATWTLTQDIHADKLLVHLNDTVTAKDNGSPLDGEWVDGMLNFAEGSGDGFSGGDFVFRFNVLPGDGDGNGGSNVLDLIYIIVTQGNLIGDPGYFVQLDLNGNGGMDVFDLLLALNTQTNPVLPLDGLGQCPRGRKRQRVV